MRALVVYCHPDPDSYTAAVRDVIVQKLGHHGAEVEVMDLYAQGFNPVLSPTEWTDYLDGPVDGADYGPHVVALKACDTLIFVYPTWWYGLPGLLKGWLDRVLLPDVAFRLPPTGDVQPMLTHVTRLAAFTTCGASRRLTWLIGSPGRRTILRGVRLLCAKRCRTAFLAHYAMDDSSAASRKAHLDKVAQKMDRFLR